MLWLQTQTINFKLLCHKVDLLALVNAKPRVKSCELQTRFNRTSEWDQRNPTSCLTGLGYVPIAEPTTGARRHIRGQTSQPLRVEEGRRGRTTGVTTEVWQGRRAVQTQLLFLLGTHRPFFPRCRESGVGKQPAGRTDTGHRQVWPLEPLEHPSRSFPFRKLVGADVHGELGSHD